MQAQWLNVSDVKTPKKKKNQKKRCVPFCFLLPVKLNLPQVRKKCTKENTNLTEE